MRRKSSFFIIFGIVLVFLLTCSPYLDHFFLDSHLSFDATATSQQTTPLTQNYTMSFGLSELSSAYSQVYRAESVGASASQIQTWSTDLNRSAFLLEEASLPSNTNNSNILIQSSVNESENVYTIARQAGDFYTTVHDSVVIASYALVLPSSYGLAILTNRTYEWYLAREERTFFRRIIRKKRASPSKR